ncbi:MAG TPA: protease [Candidatus Aminicenantes bacterium]|nr:protease [Candidatus Aminicenantes bacterium]
MKRFALFTLLMTFAISVFAFNDARLLRAPDIHENRIVFTYAGNLWTVDAAGGTAVQLTTHEGIETGARFSPDGERIAFTAQYDGNTDIYTIPAGGGEPQRITWHPGNDELVSWTPDGKSVVFSSNRENATRQLKLYTIAVDGSLAEALPLPQGAAGEFSPGGNRFAYNPLPASVFRAWRRYRGGSAPYIWIYDTKTGEVTEVPRKNSNDVYPYWMGDAVVFLSDRDRVMNLYRYTPGGAVEQLTRYTGADIKSYGTDGTRLVFEREGRLHVMATPESKARTIRVDIPDERLNLRPRLVDASKLIFGAGISPTGKRVVFGARGEIVTVPAEKGDIRNITGTPGVMERRPAWSPDGRRIACFGEKEGEYAIFLYDQKGTGQARVFEIPDPSFFYELKWSPDSRHLAFNDIKANLYILDTTNGKITRVDADPQFLRVPSPAWSPDSTWLSYRLSGENGFGRIKLYNTKTGKHAFVTDGMSDADNPVFSPEGKYLFFTASTNLAQDTAWLDMSQYPHHPTNNIYLAVLSAKEPSPFAPESDEEEIKSENDKKADPKKDKPEKKTNGEKKPVRIDPAGIESRILALDIPAGSYSSLQTADNMLYYMNRPQTGNKPSLHCYDMKERKAKELGSDLGAFILSHDGKKMLVRKNRTTWMMLDAGKPLKEAKPLKTAAIRTWSDPRKEYRQIFHEAWRINRDWFYDPGMHGQDWPAIWEQYATYLPYVSHRDDLNYLINMMLGEYTCGHAYNGGGMYPDVERVAGGLLGADYSVENGRFRIQRIYTGENWNPELRSPLAGPGIDVKEKDYIISVDGVDLTANESIHARFLQKAGKQVVLQVNSKPEAAGAREVTVIPVASEYTLRHRQWIEDNRKQVEKLSNGKVGYVYMPNTSTAGFDYFNRYFFAQLNKGAIVIDERFNGGGFVADYVINMLNRPFLSWWQPRYGAPFASPNSGHWGPKVMLINEYAGSGGDFMPWAFRKTGIGKLVGTRTWGGLVGISGYPPLMDGGYVTAPSFGIVSEDGEFIIENYGVEPDVEVVIYPRDYQAGRDPQLEKAVETVLEELKTKPARKFKHNGFPRGR